MIGVPPADRAVGMLCYSTQNPGCGGALRSAPGDFAVQEVLQPGALDGVGPSGPYPLYALYKAGTDTNGALRQVRKKTGMRLLAMGLKDSDAYTRQYLYSVSRARGPPRASGRRWRLRRLGFTQRPLSKRHMSGNRFVVRVEGAGKMPDPGPVANFYGYQRFGLPSPVTHLVGRALVRGDLDGAVRALLGADASDPERALRELPPGAGPERAVLCALARGSDPVGALRQLPVSLRRLYVNAYQSYLFNLSLSAALEAGERLGPSEGDVCYGPEGDLGRYSGQKHQRLAIPVAGHSYYAKTRFHRYVSEAASSEGARMPDFRVRALPESGAEGGFRQALISVRGFGAGGQWAWFELSRGSYATVLLRELIKPRDPALAGF